MKMLEKQKRKFSLALFKRKRNFYFTVIFLMSIAFLTFEAYSYIDTFRIVHDTTSTLTSVDLEYTSNETAIIYLHINITNPSTLYNIFVRRCNLYLLLNGERFNYIGINYQIKETVKIRSSKNFVILINVTDINDMALIYAANATSTWIWVAQIQYFIRLDSREILITHILSYEGVNVISSTKGGLLFASTSNVQ